MLYLDIQLPQSLIKTEPPPAYRLDLLPGGVLAYTNPNTRSLGNAKVYYRGPLATLHTLNINVGTYFYWS